MPSGTEPAAKDFLFPNQLPLFRRDRLGVWLLMVAGDPGRSDCRLSVEDRVRSPRNLRTEPGRRPVELVGDARLPVSPTRLWRCCGSPGPSALSWPGDVGVECDGGGPVPGSDGRGEAGGLSRGAGMVVPSVKERLTGVRVSGLYENLPGAMVVTVG